MHRSKLLRHVNLGIKNLMLHALRSLLTMLGVVFGVGSVVAMLAVGEGASEAQLKQIDKLGPRNIILTAIKAQEDEAASTSGGGGHHSMSLTIYGLLYEDLDRLNTQFDAVKRTVPVKWTRKDGHLGEVTTELRVIGTTPDWFSLVPRPLIAGRTLTEQDLFNHAPVVVLSEQAARTLVATAHTVGQKVFLGGDSYEIIGIVKNEINQGGGGVQTPDQGNDAYIPIVTYRERYGDVSIRRTSGSTDRESVELNQVLVEVKDISQVKASGEAIETMLKRFHKKTDYRVSVPLALLEQAEAQKRTSNIVLGSIAGISLLVGGIGIMNIMLASVTERTREIGIRRAIGAKQRQIIGQFLTETVVLSTLGGLVGVAMGVSLPLIISYYSGMPTIVTWYSVVLSLGISMGVGIVFGLYPAVRAARLDPITALRHE